MVAILAANLDFLDERLLKKGQVLIFYRLKTKNSLVRPRVKNFLKKNHYVICIRLQSHHQYIF